MAKFNVIVYQIKTSSKNFGFGVDKPENGGIAKADISDYLPVWNGEIEANSHIAACEKLWNGFETHELQGPRIRSFAVGDVVGSYSKENGGSLHQCDSLGWSGISWKTN